MTSEHPGMTAAEFWDRKIIGWEDSRYASAAAPGRLERVAARSSASLRFRLRAALTLLAPSVPGRRVVELGCGSGLLAEKLMAFGARSYLGIDISAVAVSRATERVTASGFGGDIGFQVASVADLEPQGDVLTFSLGLFDWLTDTEIDHVFDIASGGGYLHAVAERRHSPQQLLHRLYVHLAYGRRTGFAPRYHTMREIAAVARRHGLPPPDVFRDPRLSFGVFVTDLPLPSKVPPRRWP